jgi:LPS-assembly lipoprotein
MRRRLLLGVAATLVGCGFELKRPLAVELKTSIDATPTTRVVEAAKDAEVVLQALGETREKVVVAQTAANQIREFELRYRFSFRVRTVAGKDLIPESEIVLKRSLTYSETIALAKEQEEAFLYKTMQSDIVSQVSRRLASVQLL